MKESMVLKLGDAILRDAAIEDIDSIVIIENLSFSIPWSKEAFINELTRNKCAKYKVVVSSGQVVAYGGMWMMLDEAHITNIAVHPEFRGQGYGDLIMTGLIEAAKNNGMQSMTLEVRSTNTNAINLYKKYNFTDIAVRKGYYQNPVDDAIIMWKYELQK
jgi:ribosomal-protein-alanine N-acetyltransferase